MKKGLFPPGPGSEAYVPSPDRRRNAAAGRFPTDLHACGGAFRKGLTRARGPGGMPE
jgi:hypothetical protein